MCLSGRAPYCSKIRDLNFGGKRLDGSSPVTDKDGERLNGHFFGQSSMSRLVLAHENGAVKVEAGREELKRLAALGCGIQTGAGAILYVSCGLFSLSSLPSYLFLDVKALLFFFLPFFSPFLFLLAKFDEPLNSVIT